MFIKLQHPRRKLLTLPALFKSKVKYLMMVMEELRGGYTVSHGKGTYVVYPLSCRPASITERSTFYVVKLTEDLEDDHVTVVQTQFYSQDIIDPLPFVKTGEEHVV